MKMTIAALTLIAAILAPTVSMANIGDHDSYQGSARAKALITRAKQQKTKKPTAPLNIEWGF
ncbi:TPA: hypothetical protein PXO06_000280 [Yersinia enterocolitica]|uniref:hypothetical protein n=1 Tax=Yersinia enterocolitica TaxID=630 RepID=UPI0020C49F51|nr:hypothetical protein [Yersinia enterocolitica]HDL6853941.1 hypothetical protein [Yersinia enterocolitica]HDL6857811.1 hypothetical protein [Yersinia enterocolitica]HDL6861470.1 hypothetical protein [Yersinia enterocolitica]HDL6865508.1 hypothetical protein [Yersinia enterocolitica]HDL6869284.1 hypothetical protein [Yersinia enterocolitica]